MQKILILGLGAFGFAVAKHLGENNPDKIFYASEVNSEIYESIQTTRKHPYFFEGVKLPDNIELVKNSEEILPGIDIIISIIPCQFVGGAFESMKNSLKQGVTILNLSKGIDNQSLQTVSEKLNEVFAEKEYSYAYLAGGMIAQELVDEKMLGADIVTENLEIGETLKTLFQSNTLDINLKICPVKNTELYAALKNIIALILGYYEGQGKGASTLGYYFSKLLGEMTLLIQHLTPTLGQASTSKLSLRSVSHLSGEEREQTDFTDYALSGDLIATCFGASRNRLLGNMLGEGKDIEIALEELRAQKKIAEGYETLKGVYKLTQGKQGFEEINIFAEKYL